MELEKAVNLLKKTILVNNSIIKEATKNGDINVIELTNDLDTQSSAIEIILKALENSISKDKIKEKIKKYKEMADDFYIKFLESDKLDLEIRDAGFSCDMKAEALQELLEGK